MDNSQYLLIALLLLSACGKPVNNLTVDPAFQTAYQKFMSDSSLKGVRIDNSRTFNLSIEFADLGQPGNGGGFIIGLCTIGNTDKNGNTLYQVQIDKSFWDWADVYTQESLLFHELGHCLLGRKHRTDLKSSGQPESIMYPYVVTSNVYDADQETYEGYTSELFSRIGDSNSVQGCETQMEIL